MGLTLAFGKSCPFTPTFFFCPIPKHLGKKERLAAGSLCPWGFLDKNTRAGVGCLFLLQGLFLTQIEPTSLMSLALAGMF